jgi:hypothetical protein
MPEPEHSGSLTSSGLAWDEYVRRWSQDRPRSRGYKWPGDEWGDPDTYPELYDCLFSAAPQWRNAVEIGPGSGKYADRVPRASDATIRAYDVSPEFIRVCEQRCAHWIDSQRLSLHLLQGISPSEMLDDLASAGLLRNVDAFFSIDAMVHVELQYLVVYLIVSALALREGGQLLLTLANPTSEKGFDKLLRDIRWTYPEQRAPGPGARFAWVSPDLVKFLLSQLGFDVAMCPRSPDRRDTWLVATLRDVVRADEFEARLRSTAPRTYLHRL